MKIGIFTDTYFPQVNGVTFTISLWKKELEKRGHEVYVYYPGGEYKPCEREYPVPSVEFIFYDDFRIGIPSGLTEKTGDLDIVHIHGLFSMAIAALMVSKKHKLPRMLTYHTPGDEYIGYITKNKTAAATLKRVYDAWEKTLLNSCRIVTCPTNEIREMLRIKGVKKPVTLSNGVDLHLFRPVESARFKTDHGIRPGRVIGFCGRLGYEKHLEDLINIADEFKGDIIIAGKGPAEKHYMKLAKSKKNVKFLGFIEREKLPEFYSALDVFVFPSTAETQGLVALESMACGTPVVGAKALALKDTIRYGSTGYLYNSGNLGRLLSMIELSFKNREKLSLNCLDYVLDHSLEKTIDALIDMYAQLLEGELHKRKTALNDG